MLLALTLALTVTLHIPQVVTGPNSSVPDSAPFEFNNNLYIANGTSYILTGTGLISVLEAGENFDSCGAWLHAAYQDGSIARGWYHAETECGYAYNYQTHKSIAYTESYDEGLTWIKPDYPNNQVITAPPYIPDALYDDEGDFSIVQNGDYYYLYFQTSRDKRVHLARSLISSGGLPGTWFKWYQGGFTEPGLGGESDPLAWQWELQTPWVSWHEGLQHYIALNRRHGGWALSVSEDGIHWQGLDCVLIPDAGIQWAGRETAIQRLVDYMSFVGDDLYYMEVLPFEAVNKRYLMRQELSFDGSLPGCVVQSAAVGQVGYLPGVWK